MATQNNLQFNHTKKFDYAAFIEELRPLLEQTGKFPMAKQNAQSDVFLRWKLRLTDLLTQIERLGYSIRCDVGQRVFANMYGSGSDRVWVHHMTETRHELELIIENYEKYGEPEPIRKGKSSYFGGSPAPVPRSISVYSTDSARVGNRAGFARAEADHMGVGEEACAIAVGFSGTGCVCRQLGLRVRARSEVRQIPRFTHCLWVVCHNAGSGGSSREACVQAVGSCLSSKPFSTLSTSPLRPKRCCACWRRSRSLRQRRRC